VIVSDELRAASDETIENAVKHADPMILRGILHQLMGDDSVADLSVRDDYFGYAFVNRIVRDEDVELLRQKASSFLRRCRASTTVELGSEGRLYRSLSLTAGVELPEVERAMWLEQSAFNPWARGLDKHMAVTPTEAAQFTVGVIGSGLSGLNAAVHLKRAGIPFVVLEKNEDVGGTWWENHYPGARVDSPSRIYNHIFGVSYTYPNVFCTQEVNHQYMRWVAEHFEVLDNIEFNTEVASLVWDENHKQWTVTTKDVSGKSRIWHFNAIISCVGFLSRPKMPEIEGMGDFRGTSFHTTRWPQTLELAGKRVAVIGSGASSYQLTPEVAKIAAHTFLFQRTPSWCFENETYVKPLTQESIWLDRNFPYYVNFSRLRYSSFFGPENVGATVRIVPGFVDPDTVSPANKEMRDMCIASLKKKFARHPELIEKMIPDSPPMASRPIMIDDQDSILDALVRDNVTLVTDTIDRVTANGIRAAGKEHPVDIIVYATGFRANDYLWPMKITGRNGSGLEELWAKDGARAYLGSMLPGFPNFFMAYGPNTNNNGGFQYIDLMEIEVRFALQSIAWLIKQRKAAVDVSTEAYWRFNDELDRMEKMMVYMDPRAHNYWTTGKGRSATNGPIDFRRMWNWLRDPSRPVPGELDAGIKPYFGEDLLVT
jgi:4-hydroxyacetophenone monooxygenase